MNHLALLASDALIEEEKDREKIELLSIWLTGLHLETCSVQWIDEIKLPIKESVLKYLRCLYSVFRNEIFFPSALNRTKSVVGGHTNRLRQKNTQLKRRCWRAAVKLWHLIRLFPFHIYLVAKQVEFQGFELTDRNKINRGVVVQNRSSEVFAWIFTWIGQTASRKWIVSFFKVSNNWLRQRPQSLNQCFILWLFAAKWS